MSLSFRIPTCDETAARNQAAELASMVTLEPVSVDRDGSDVRIEVHHPLALLVSALTGLLCCGCGRVSRLLCPGHDAMKPHSTQGA